MNSENKNIQEFYKMNGAGNTFLFHDSRNNTINMNQNLVLNLGSYFKEYSFDQFIQLMKPKRNGDGHIKFWNADGTESGMCGNALRCVSHIILEETKKEKIILETIDKDIECWRNDNEISVNIGKPKFDWSEIPLSRKVDDTLSINLDPSPIELPNFTAINVGNPHAVFFFNKNRPELEEVGSIIENHEIFAEKVNVSFAKISHENHIQVNVWERGTGITKACGSAACAIAVAAHKLNLSGRKVLVSFSGGDLKIVWKEDNDIVMTGPYEIEEAVEINLMEL